MAAAKAPKTVQLLDPTVIGTSRAVRYPRTNGRVIQGKVRFPNSNAAKNFAEQETVRLKKALQHLTHGKNIFAYNNMRTNQVIYSLSRTLDRDHVLSQLIYHGKKTVPASLRKDMWIPYFSVHFPSPSLGLRAYQLLREFSIQRQLSPPVEMITNSEKTLSRKRPKDPEEAKEWDKTWKPRLGQIMMKKDRAKVLMNQKATSVADVAAALAIQEESEGKMEEQELKEGTEGEGEGEKKLSHKARKRIIRARKLQQKHEEDTRKRIEELERGMSRKNVQVKVDTEGLENFKVSDGEVKLLWADIQDAQYARNWPQRVAHGELAPASEHIMSANLKSFEPEDIAAVQPQESADTTKEADPGVKESSEAPAKKGLNRLKFW